MKLLKNALTPLDKISVSFVCKVGVARLLLVRYSCSNMFAIPRSIYESMTAIECNSILLSMVPTSAKFVNKEVFCQS